MEKFGLTGMTEGRISDHSILSCMLDLSLANTAGVENGTESDTSCISGEINSCVGEMVDGGADMNAFVARNLDKPPTKFKYKDVPQNSSMILRMRSI